MARRIRAWPRGSAKRTATFAPYTAHHANAEARPAWQGIGQRRSCRYPMPCGQRARGLGLKSRRPGLGVRCAHRGGTAGENDVFAKYPGHGRRPGRRGRSLEVPGERICERRADAVEHAILGGIRAERSVRIDRYLQVPRWSFKLPEGVQVRPFVGTKMFSMLAPPGATTNVGRS